MSVRLMAEIDEKNTFIDGVLEDAEKEGRDLNSQEMELVTRARTRLGELSPQLEALKELQRIGVESRQHRAEIAEFTRDRNGEQPTKIEYRSAGEYALDMWQAGLGNEQAKNRLHVWRQENRAASHQTTADNPGLIPSPIVGPVVNFIDAARPVVSALGPRQLPGTGFSRPKVTQHTAVAVQSGEKQELTSQKMTIGKITVTPATWGGYVNVSRQDIDWSQPSVMDLVIQDLAAQYAIMTEGTAVQAFYGTATQGGTIPGTPTGDNTAAAFWGAAASVYTATKGQGRTIAVASPDVLGTLGVLFQPVNPMNQQGEGFSAGAFGLGAAGSIAGIPVYVTSGFSATKRLMLLSTAAAEVYEDRIGALSVVEPSVLGVQVAYAGYFAPVVIEATGIVKVTVT
jgi:HK97 family phage major capsid protein